MQREARRRRAAGAAERRLELGDRTIDPAPAVLPAPPAGAREPPRRKGGPRDAPCAVAPSVPSVPANEPAGPRVGISDAIRERAGVSGGVGSSATQPKRSNHASTHAWASVSRTIHAALRSEYPPGEKPTATRAGTPPIRSSSAMAP